MREHVRGVFVAYHMKSNEIELFILIEMFTSPHNPQIVLAEDTSP